jgi:hypothetical protein
MLDGSRTFFFSPPSLLVPVESEMAIVALPATCHRVLFLDEVGNFASRGGEYFRGLLSSVIVVTRDQRDNHLQDTAPLRSGQKSRPRMTVQVVA